MAADQNSQVRGLSLDIDLANQLVEQQKKELDRANQLIEQQSKEIARLHAEIHRFKLRERARSLDITILPQELQDQIMRMCMKVDHYISADTLKKFMGQGQMKGIIQLPASCRSQWLSTFLEVNTVDFSVEMCVNDFESVDEIRDLYYDYVARHKLNIDLSKTIRSFFWYAGLHVSMSPGPLEEVHGNVRRSAAVARCVNMRHLRMYINVVIDDRGYFERTPILDLIKGVDLTATFKFLTKLAHVQVQFYVYAVERFAQADLASKGTEKWAKAWCDLFAKTLLRDGKSIKVELMKTIVC